jgi:dipeptidase
MCDTLYLPKDLAPGGRALFAKNSDRERNEAQVLEMHAARAPAEGGSAAATYIRVPEDRPTLPCLLSRPFWGFGAEMGVNARGVVIGNEALMSRPGLPSPARRGGLTGMDLLRLALERASSAREAVATITGLLEAHGQGGDCGHLSRFHYHNGFLIADAEEAFVLETLGRDWAAERVAGPRAISNAYSIVHPNYGQSAGLQALLDAATANTKGGLARLVQDPVRAQSGCAGSRSARSRLHLRGPSLGVGGMMAALRDHGGETADMDAPPAKTVCMHAGARGRRSQTVASMVCEIDAHGGVVWATAASAPCLCVFRPVFFDVGLAALGPSLGPTPSDRADDQSRWWRHERAHRLALHDFHEVLERFAPERDALEAQMILDVESLKGAPLNVRARAQAAFWAKADDLEARMLPQSSPGVAAPEAVAPGAFQRSWRRLSRTAGLDI